jgi:glycosyltransferase involved in cell wall biosynthesis
MGGAQLWTPTDYPLSIAMASEARRTAGTNQGIARSNVAAPSQTIGYLSGALRVSTRDDAAAGGPRAHVLGVIQAFERLGWEVPRYIAGDEWSSRFRESGEEDLVGRWPKRAGLDAARYLFGQVNARRAFRKIGVEVHWVYERFASFQALGRRFQRIGVPWVLETQGPFWIEASLERRSMALQGWARRLEMSAYRDCDVLVSVSDELSRLLVTEVGLDPAKVITIPNGVDLDFFKPELTHRSKGDGDLQIVFVGSLIPWQRLDILLEAIWRLEQSGGETVELVVVGDGPIREELQAKVRTRELRSRVGFLGRLPRSDVPPVIASADLGYVGHSEQAGRPVYGSPLKLYEYLAMGVPVLAGETPETRAVVHDGENGFLFQPANVTSLTRTLRRCMTDRERLVLMGRNARLTAQAHSWEARVHDLVRAVKDRLE